MQPTSHRVHSMPSPFRVVFACTLALLMLAATACKENAANSTAAPSPPVHVESVVVTEQPMPRVLLLTGNLRGQHETDLAANAAGRVLATFVERGAQVKKGDILAKLDIRAASLGAAEAKAAAELARTQASNATRDCERTAKLFQEGSISRAEYDRISDQCRTTPLSVAASEARAQAAAIVVGDGVIRAPFGGVVTERYIEVGQFVRQDTKVVALVDLEQLKLEFTVPETNLSSVKEGNRVSFTVSAYPDRSFEGVVKYVGASVRTTTRDLVAEAVVANPDKLLRPGMFASVVLQTGDQMTAVVPKLAVVNKDGRTHVLVVADGRVDERVIQTGTSAGDVIAVTKGLHAGDKVVIKPPEGLRNGQLVN
jgi:membrane fusion protein, multidrug efflux system